MALAGSDDVAVASRPAVVATTEVFDTFVDRWLAETVHAGSAAIEEGGGLRKNTRLSHRGRHKKGDDGHERPGDIPDLHRDAG